MRKKYLRLQKLLNKGTLSASHIEAHRDCDAIIGAMLGWKDVELDNAKEWTADITAPFREFDCAGRCVVPNFTGRDYFKLLNFIHSTLKDNERLDLIINKSKVTIIMVGDTPITVNGANIALAVCKLFVERYKSETKT